MDGWIYVLIISLLGLAFVVAWLVWDAKFGFGKTMATNIFERVLEWAAVVAGAILAVVKILFGLVGKLLQQLVPILIFITFGFSCYGYWAVGDFFYADETWEKYCPFMCVISLIGGITSGIIGMSLADDDDLTTIFVFGPILVSFLVFVIFGALHIVNLMAG
jgi:hypothetical protein